MFNRFSHCIMISAVLYLAMTCVNGSFQYPCSKHQDVRDRLAAGSRLPAATLGQLGITAKEEARHQRRNAPTRSYSLFGGPMIDPNTLEDFNTPPQSPKNTVTATFLESRRSNNVLDDKPDPDEESSLKIVPWARNRRASVLSNCVDIEDPNGGSESDWPNFDPDPKTMIPTNRVNLPAEGLKDDMILARNSNKLPTYGIQLPPKKMEEKNVPENVFSNSFQYENTKLKRKEIRTGNMQFVKPVTKIRTGKFRTVPINRYYGLTRTPKEKMKSKRGKA